MRKWMERNEGGEVVRRRMERKEGERYCRGKFIKVVVLLTTFLIVGGNLLK